MIDITLAVSELAKWDKVNQCETIEDFCKILLELSDGVNIKGRTKLFDVHRMIENAKLFYNGDIYSANVITREYGLRQQLIYLKHYK